MNSTLDSLTLAYLAGCIDSDGYMSIRSDTWQVKMGQRVTPTCNEMIGLRQVTPVVPYMLHSAFGGHVYITKGRTATNKSLYSWHAESRMAANAVLALRPYLRIKGAQADILLALRAHKDERAADGRRSGRHNRVSDAELAYRAELLAQIRTLNAVGLAPE